ncbi:uncharacterized protein BDR25DRAFT_131861 [Lindgomyces ingoldianus]|uniref:Uncharacterized protein n=1 Tax=Lindgomyces ingoldianus TaxID=673940 RepID=A0ACB6R2X9_9PLEO|nr:uncharacterized protein BDR25DRAFT_131861 [Lindgomyces ingoldianus]KAF2473417.1 hypothetical protein BDR25DRAFT_131861 [Lindgomyces ingoldianus]
MGILCASATRGAALLDTRPPPVVTLGASLDIRSGRRNSIIICARGGRPIHLGHLRFDVLVDGIPPVMTLRDALRKIFRHSKKEEHQEELITQNVRSRYFSETKLVQLMEDLFGKGNFRVRMQNDQWIFDVPREVTDEELKRAKG